jgi:hypothetical protein
MALSNACLWGRTENSERRILTFVVSVRLHTYHISFPIGRCFKHLTVCTFIRICQEIASFGKVGQKFQNTLHRTPRYIYNNVSMYY